jgi:hypothetical protein
MTTTPDWLERLNKATNYQQLREILAELTADVRDGENPELAHGIDEAVRRLEVERSDDQEELREIQARYESFKEEHRGLLGWIMRHLPFTSTRRKEVEHRRGVADQEAEILADSLVIARLQMFKERILPTTERKLGLRPHDWEARLKQASAKYRPEQLAPLIKDLLAEQDDSRAFSQELKSEVDAFEQAKFQSADDRQRRDADLAQARRELAEIESEIDREAQLKQEAFSDFGRAVRVDLEVTNPEFRQDGEKAIILEAGLADLDKASTATAALTAQAGTVRGLARELASLPDELDRLRDSINRQEGKRGELAAQCARASGIVDERRSRWEEADAAVKRQQHVLAGAKQAFDAYQAQQKSEQAMPVAVEADTTSPMWRQYSEAQAALAAAEARRSQAAAPYESAKREAAAAQAALDKLTGELAGLRSQLDKRQESEPRLRRELDEAKGACQTAFSTAALALGGFLRLPWPAARPPFRPEELAPGTFGWLAEQGLQDGLAEALVDNDQQRQSQGLAVLDAISRWQAGQREALDRERSAARQRRDAVWKRRCLELLGDALTEEARTGSASDAARQ